SYRLDLLHRTHTHEVFDAVLEPGKHRIALDGQATKGRSFIVARAMGGVLVAPMVR
ncbi:MAG TPA: oxidoreductase, partial [Streptomyces sp.]|nr:oxidoreductase [Streptomyces sp.]